VPVISATSRTTIDACRTLLVWIVSLGLGWEVYVAAACPLGPLLPLGASCHT